MINQHISFAFLEKYGKLNQVDFTNRDKAQLLEEVKKFLNVYNLVTLPVLIVNTRQDTRSGFQLYLTPVLVKNLICASYNFPTLELQQQALSAAELRNYFKNYYEKNNKLSTSVQNLYELVHFVGNCNFIDQESCLKLFKGEQQF